MNEGPPTTVYVLVDPRSFEVRYVGVTVQQLHVRLGGHLKEARRGWASYKCNWIRSLDEPPLIQAVAVLPHHEALLAEREWISYFKTLGCRLTNATTGGEGIPGGRHEEVSREAISAGQVRAWAKRTGGEYRLSEEKRIKARAYQREWQQRRRDAMK